MFPSYQLEVVQFWKDIGEISERPPVTIRFQSFFDVGLVSKFDKFESLERKIESFEIIASCHIRIHKPKLIETGVLLRQIVLHLFIFSAPCLVIQSSITVLFIILFY